MKSISLLCLIVPFTLGCCAPRPEPVATLPDFSACAAARPSMEVMDKFLAAFNAKDTPGFEATFHYPHMRIASYPLQVLTGPGQQDDIFGSLAAEDWASSRWDARTIVQCGKDKAHILATFARLHADGTEYVKYDGLYVVELRDGFWGITARSTFAP
ncbi:MAG: hypothetical protein ABMA14_09820 [Hyphomonadaceae bacterium]